MVGESYIKGCAFHDGFAPAIGVFGTDGLSIEDNVIHHTVGEGADSMAASLLVVRRILFNNVVTLELGNMI